MCLSPLLSLEKARQTFEKDDDASTFHSFSKRVAAGALTESRRDLRRGHQSPNNRPGANSRKQLLTRQLLTSASSPFLGAHLSNPSAVTGNKRVVAQEGGLSVDDVEYHGPEPPPHVDLQIDAAIDIVLSLAKITRSRRQFTENMCRAPVAVELQKKLFWYIYCKYFQTQSVRQKHSMSERGISLLFGCGGSGDSVFCLLLVSILTSDVTFWQDTQQFELMESVSHLWVELHATLDEWIPAERYTFKRAEKDSFLTVRHFSLPFPPSFYIFFVFLITPPPADFPVLAVVLLLRASEAYLFRITRVVRRFAR
jgi:hypothetical protein